MRLQHPNRNVHERSQRLDLPSTNMQPRPAIQPRFLPLPRPHLIVNFLEQRVTRHRHIKIIDTQMLLGDKQVPAQPLEEENGIQV